MAIGPSLPPHLQAKRKHSSDAEDDDRSSRDSSSPDTAEKRRRTIGPSLPSAPLEEHSEIGIAREPVAKSASNSDNDSDDDYGPALPSAPSDASAIPESKATILENQGKAETTPTARDSWMLRPPGQDDLTSRMDPSRIRARKFNTGKAGRAPAGGSGEIDAIWTETPEQKATRLKNSVMGVSKPATTAEAKAAGRSKEDIETAKRLEKARGKSLLETHQGRQDAPKEDDPSKRAFDYEKDVGGVRIGHAQKKEMLGRAKEFGSKFSGGSYL